VRVRFDEAGADANLRSSGFLRYAQDVAWLHSEEAGFDRRWYAARGLTWLVRSIDLDLREPVGYGSHLVVTTEVVGFRRVWARRRSEVCGARDGALKGLLAIDWVLLGPAGTPTRVPEEILGAFPVALPSFTPARLELSPPPADAFRERFVARSHEIDPMGHVNNAAYLDYMEQAVALAGGGDTLRRWPRRYRLDYALPAGPDIALVGRAWRQPDSWAYRLEDEAGRQLFRAALLPGRQRA
jgi:acyl-ACP thioesterase